MYLPSLTYEIFIWILIINIDQTTETILCILKRQYFARADTDQFVGIFVVSEQATTVVQAKCILISIKMLQQKLYILILLQSFENHVYYECAGL